MRFCFSSVRIIISTFFIGFIVIITYFKILVLHLSLIQSCSINFRKTPFKTNTMNPLHRDGLTTPLILFSIIGNRKFFIFCLLFNFGLKSEYVSLSAVFPVSDNFSCKCLLFRNGSSFVFQTFNVFKYVLTVGN